MSGEDHVATARAVYDKSAPRYVQFVGTEISSVTEGPIDRSLLVAFIELIKRRTVIASPMSAAGQAEWRRSWRNVDSMSSAWTCQRRCSLSLGPHIRTSSSKRVSSMHSPSTGVLAGAVCWKSIIYTPPDRLAEAFGELKRVLMPQGFLLLAFQAEGEPIHRADAQGTHLPLTSYRHKVQEVAGFLEDTGFKIYATVLRSPELEGETTPKDSLSREPPS